MKLKTIFKNIVVLTICLTMVLSVSMPNVFAFSYEKSSTIRFEAEKNGVWADYNGGNAALVFADPSASGGGAVREGLSNWHWSFTAPYTGSYSFEIFVSSGSGNDYGNLAGDATSTFKVGGQQVYQGEVLGTLNGDSWAPSEGRLTKLGGSINLTAGVEYKLELKFGGSTCQRVIDYFDIHYDAVVVPETDITLNAVEDFDRAAGAGVGFFDSTSDKVDGDCDQNDPDKIEVFPAVGKYGECLYITDEDWFRYTVNVGKAGYYRVLLGLKSSSLDIKVKVNDMENVASVKRSNAAGNWVIYPYSYDNAGLFYFNEGDNYIYVESYNFIDGQSAHLHEVRIVSPDVDLIGNVEAQTVKYSVTKATNTSVNEVAYVEGFGDNIYLDAPYDNSTYGPDFIEWTVYAPTTGTYTIKLNVAYNNGANGADTPRGHLMIDGIKACNTTDVTTGSNVLCTTELTRGYHTIRYNHEGYRVIRVTSIECDAPAGLGIVYKLNGAGTYMVEVDVTDYYKGITHNTFDSTHGEMWIPWSATKDETIKDIKLVAAVYNGKKLVNAYVSNKVDVAPNATNSDLEDYTIKVNDIVVGEGETVKLLLWDAADAKPLTDFIEYK